MGDLGELGSRNRGLSIPSARPRRQLVLLGCMQAGQSSPQLGNTVQWCQHCFIWWAEDRPSLPVGTSDTHSACDMTTAYESSTSELCGLNAQCTGGMHMQCTPCPLHQSAAVLPGGAMHHCTPCILPHMHLLVPWQQ